MGLTHGASYSAILQTIPYPWSRHHSDSDGSWADYSYTGAAVVFARSIQLDTRTQSNRVLLHLLHQTVLQAMTRNLRTGHQTPRL